MSNIFKVAQPVRVGNFASNPSDVSAGAIYWNTGSSALFVADGTSYSQLAISTNEFLSGVFRINDSSDPTKKLSFDVSGLTGSTTRTIIMPNANVDLGNLTNSNISASAAIAYSKLNLSASIVNADVNASAAIAYSKLNLSASIVNADINASAAIAYSKLNLSASIVNADIAAAAAIALNKLAALTASRLLVSDASGFISVSAVTSTEAGYLSGVTSAIQTQINAKISSSEKGANNGVASLDAGGKVPVSQLPNSIMEYQGTWNANTNTPTLADGTGNAGDVYVVSVAGTQNLGSGSITFAAGDWVMYNGSIWEKSSSSNSVVSVNGQTGVVVLTTTNVAEGSNLYFSDERAQDAVGAMVANSSKVSLTYVDGAPSLTADIIAGSLVNADVNASAAIAYSKLNLSASIVNADVNASAAIAYSKLNLSASIVNADINASAAIDASKLADGSVSNAEFQFINSVTSNVQDQLDAKLGTSLSDGNILVGNASNVATSVNPSGDIDISNAGVFSINSGVIVNADVNASAAIAYSKLNLSASIVNADVNASAAIAYSKLNLSASIVNADINASAAIAYSKLNLSASIVNADIAAAAAIALNKLAALTPDRALQSDGSGFVSVSAVTSTELGYVSGVTSAIQTQLDTKVAGPGSATDEALARFDGTTGKLIQNSSSSLTDAGILTIADTFRRGDGGLVNYVEEEYMDILAITASTTAVQAGLTFDSRNFKKVEVDYEINNGNDRRGGKITIVCNNAAAAASSVVSITDQSTETAEINLSWSAAVNGNNIELSYTTLAGTYGMRADVKRFRA